MKRHSPLERIDKIISVIEQVENITGSIKHDALYRGDVYSRTVAQRIACTHLYPPVSLASYYRYLRQYMQYRTASSMIQLPDSKEEKE